MTDADDGQHSPPDQRATRDVPGDAITLRQPDDEDGVFDVRMPIATTGEVRNEGDEPLTREELDGMARQIAERTVGVFLDHGRSPIGGRERYSATEKVGEWVDADVREREANREAEGDGERQADTEELVATARVMDPETLPAAAGTLRESLASIKEQVQRDFSLAASIGWRDDESFPGGVDLMEASIVGIGADPRTTSDADSAAVVARAAVDAGADAEQLLARVRQAVASERPLGPPEDPDRFDTFEECVQALMDDEDIDRESAERICGSWEAAKDEQNHDMTEQDDQPADDAGDTTEQEEQETDTDDAEERAPDDFSVQDWADLLASHFDGVDPSDFMEAWEGFADDYVGAVDLNEWAAATADITDSDTGTVQDALEELMDTNEADEDEEEDEDDENDAEEPDDEQSDEAEDEPDAEQDADLRQEVESLREELAELRDGGLSPDDVDTPEEPDEEQAADGDDKHELTTKYGLN